MKSTSKKRTPSIVNLTVKRRYLTEREVERLMDCARKYDRYVHRDATMILAPMGCASGAGSAAGSALGARATSIAPGFPGHPCAEPLRLLRSETNWTCAIAITPRDSSCL